MIKNPLDILDFLHRKQAPVTAAFLGGSITWGGASGDNENRSYRALVSRWLQKHFANSAFTSIHGGFGGTGSLVGAYRHREHILSHRPDLLFIEFAINDSLTPQGQIMACHEAIVRQTWEKNPHTAIILLVSGSRDDRQVVAVSRQISQDLRLPLIDVGAAKRKLILAGKETAASLWADCVHPSPHGHAVYARIVNRALAVFLRTARSRQTRYALPDGVRYWNTPAFINARLLPARRCQTHGKGWQLTDTQYRHFDGVYPSLAEYPERHEWPFLYRHGLLRTRTPGDTISYTGKLHGAGIALDYTKGLCEIAVTVDGEEVQIIRYKQASGRFPRLPEIDFPFTGKRHTLEFTLRRGQLNVGYLAVR